MTRLRTIAACDALAIEQLSPWHDKRAEDVAGAAWSATDALRNLSPEQLRKNRVALIEAREFVEQAYAAAFPEEARHG